DTPDCPQRALHWLVLEKIPLLILCAISAWLSYRCQQATNAIGSLEHFPVSSRLANASLTYVPYLPNMVWPSAPGPLDPLPKSFVGWEVALATVVVLGITVAAAWQARRRPYLLVGWLWYLGMLLPVIGILRMGVEIAMADRYAYLPMIGIYLAVVWSVFEAL